MGGGGGYYAFDGAHTSPGCRQFLCGGRTVSAFRWDNGKLYGLAIEGTPEYNIEYQYLHLMTRTTIMKFEPGLEKKNSFMIIPNEFTEDHELTPEEIQKSITPSPEYERDFRKRFPNFRAQPNIFQRIRRFCFDTLRTDGITMAFKNAYNRRFRGRLNEQIMTYNIGALEI